MAYKSKYTGAQIDEAVEKTLSASGGGGGTQLYANTLEFDANNLSYKINFLSHQKEFIDFGEFLAYLNSHTIFVSGIITEPSSDSIRIILSISLGPNILVVNSAYYDETSNMLTSGATRVAESDVSNFTFYGSLPL